jgi:hypothetical protein
MSGHLAAYRRHLRDLGRADSTVEGYLELLTRMDRELPQGPWATLRLCVFR